MRFYRIKTRFLDGDVWTDGLFSQPIMAPDLEAAVTKMAEVLAERGTVFGDGPYARLYDGFEVVAEVRIAKP